MIISIILAIAGLFLIFLEFFLPGAIMGIGGGILLIASVVVFLLNGPSVLSFAFFLIILAAALTAVIRFAMHRVKATAKKGTIYLESDQEGYQASSYRKELIGKHGIAATDLKPSGHIYLDNHYMQATARGGYIEKGQEIEIVGGEGSHLIVKLANKKD